MGLSNIHRRWVGTARTQKLIRLKITGITFDSKKKGWVKFGVPTCNWMRSKGREGDGTGYGHSMVWGGGVRGWPEPGGT
jgi:hypothetical protein